MIYIRLIHAHNGRWKHTWLMCEQDKSMDFINKNNFRQREGISRITVMELGFLGQGTHEIAWHKRRSSVSNG